ncbi:MULTISPECIES: HNH endonuclease [Spirulina sp. CCY15215]|uniref:HNH endonuclease n=1 Tax=Spirulina sp. CCY15215 TaxID=2767591 RepID=UPI00194E98B3|nr:HNH endonuclease [Spirulina major]
MGQNRPYKHRKAQKEVKEYEQYQCMVCGKISQNAQGHHLIPYSEGGSADMQNMITLCLDCHRKYHRGELNIDIYRF